VSAHDALTYSAKAATHKTVHPYVRYGIVIGQSQEGLPRRLIWHGDHFDFMATVASHSKKLTKRDRDRLVQLVKQEIDASRRIYSSIYEKSTIWLLHRKLEVR
jgi:hypothetical protein